MENWESGMATAASLPPEVLTSIFQFLDTENKGRAAQVCTSWRKAADSKFLWQGVEVKLRSKFVNLETSCSMRNRDLKRLRLLDFAPRVEICLPERLIDFVQNVPKVHSLNLSDCLGLSNELLKAMIINLPLLCELNLSGSPRIHNQWLQAVSSRMKSLQALFLNEHTIHALNCVSGVRDGPLEGDSFSEKFCHEMTRYLQRQLKRISQKFCKVVSLYPGECMSKINEELSYLFLLKKLESLNLAFSVTLNNRGMGYITRLTSLKYLDLTACLLINDDGFEFLSQLTNLTGLNLSLCFQITNATLKHLSKSASLRKLNLCCCTITDLGLSHLTSGDLKLTELNLSCCYYIGDKGISYLCQSSFILEDLCLSCTSVTNYGISQIVGKFPRLQGLKSTVHCLSDKSVQEIYEKLEYLRGVVGVM